MRATRPEAGRALLVPLLLLSLATQWSCKGCEERAAGSPTASEATHDTEDKLQPVDIEIDIPIGQLPEGLEFGPAETEEWLRYAGTVDVEDRYASVVMISRKDDPGLCSGVLISDRLVLTAGSCVCLQQPSGKSVESTPPSPQASSCVKRVSITTVVHGGDVEAQRGRRRLRTYEGNVRPHPEMESRAGTHGFSSTRADLAVIVLDEPVQERPAEVLLAANEVREGEALLMVGYGKDEALGGDWGARYYRKNKATRAPGAEDDRVLYEQQGPYVYDGFVGGPCFREGPGGRWLVGIAGASSGKGLSCTSLHVHREWVRAEVRRALQGSSAPP